jgi:hypothetical protein
MCVCIGVQTAKQAERELAQLNVLRTIKKTYACQHCDPDTVPVGQRIQTAGRAPVGPLAKGYVAPTLFNKDLRLPRSSSFISR